MELTRGSLWREAGKHHCSDDHPQDITRLQSRWMWVGGCPSESFSGADIVIFVCFVVAVVVVVASFVAALAGRPFGKLFGLCVCACVCVLM